MFQMKKNSDTIFRLQGYLPTVILLGVSVVLFLAVVWPNFNKILDNNSKIASLNDNVAALTRKKQVLDSFNAGELKDIEQKARVALPTEKSFSGLLTGLEILALQASSKLVEFDSSPGLISATTSALAADKELRDRDTLPSNMGYLDAKVGINSNSANLIDLSGKIVKSGRLITLESVEFDGVGNKGETSNTIIKLRAYYQPLPKQLEDIAQLTPITLSDKEVVSKVDSFNQFALQMLPTLPSQTNLFDQVVPTATSSPVTRF